MSNIYSLDVDELDDPGLVECSEFIQNGKLVAFPTETVYGLGANALDENAVRSIYNAKGRPSDNPIIVHVSDRKMLNKVVADIPENAKKLMRRFWPGPLTIIFKKSDIVPLIVTGGLKTVAVRMPAHPTARELIRLSKLPIAAPSANISGRPSTTSARHVIEDLKGRVEAIIDGGETDYGLESTVIDVSGKTPVLLRPGTITLEEMERVIGEIVVADPNSEKPLSPGMKYRHYAPDTSLFLFTGETEDVMRSKMIRMYKDMHKKNKRVAIMGSRELSKELSTKIRSGYDYYTLGTREKLGQMGARIFKALRDLDKENYDMIMIGACSEQGVGLAIMNRLKKAASKII